MGMNEPHEPHVNLNKLATLSHHDVYLEVTRDHKPVSYPSWPNIYPPDEHVMCIDFLYWASILKPFEWETRYIMVVLPAPTIMLTFDTSSYSPGWKIAKHLRWTPKLTSIAQEYLMRLFKVPYKEDVPPVSLFFYLFSYLKPSFNLIRDIIVYLHSRKTPWFCWLVWQTIRGLFRTTRSLRSPRARDTGRITIKTQKWSTAQGRNNQRRAWPCLVGNGARARMAICRSRA